MARCHPYPVYLLILLLAGLLSSLTASTECVSQLLRDGQSDWSISIADSTNEEVLESARLLQQYFGEISKVQLPIHRISQAGPRSIVLQTGAIPSDTVVSPACLVEGYRIRISADRVELCAPRPRGLQHAVYAFLEEELGCRMYGVNAKELPQLSDICLPACDRVSIPVFSFRMQDFKDPEYVDWQRMSTLAEWGLFVHTFHDLVPPEEYFQTHPEYYSENRGTRVADGQLCLSNPEVMEIVVQELRQRMLSNPSAQYWSVSQNDTYLPCDCSECRRINQIEGSPSGSLLRFVNGIAAEFPDKTISTLAYQYSRQAPRITKPAPNVNIMLCSIECDRATPIAEGCTDFAVDLMEWGALTDNIFLWDYVIQFRNLMSPFPNLHVLQPNLQFFAEQGITAVFEQGLAEMYGEFAELRAYMLAKLMWDPYADADSIRSDFLEGYYGPAAPFVAQYIDTMHCVRAAAGEGLSCFGYPFPTESGYLSPFILQEYQRLFNLAEAATTANPKYHARVQTARLPLQYARLEQAKLLADAPGGCFEHDASGRRYLIPTCKALLDTFFYHCERAEVPRLWEHGVSPLEYYDSTKAFFIAATQSHLALHADVSLLTPASSKYHDGDAAALTDGLDAWNDYHMHWLGFEGEDMIATLDLGVTREVSEIDCAFLQDIMAWIFLPEETVFSLSTDGELFEEIAQIERSLSADMEGAIRVPQSVEFQPRRARYIRVHARSMKECPAWHKGAGGPSWIFCDEIRVY